MLNSDEGVEASGSSVADGGNAGVGGSPALVPLDLGSLKEFDTKENPNGISQRWKKWKRAFNLYLLGRGVTVDSQKQALLLHVAGLEVQDIYYTLVGDEAVDGYEATIKVLDDYFIPKSNVSFERHLFRQIVQKSDETVDQFACRLKQQAVNCGFGDQEDDYIRDQLIDKCYSNHLQRKFLEKTGSVKLDDLLVIARAQEAVDRQLKALDSSSNNIETNFVGKSSSSCGNGKVPGQRNVGIGQNQGKSCFNCGRQGHFARDKVCPARGQTCKKCGGVGHFKVKCPKASGNSKHDVGHHSKEKGNGFQNRSRKNRQVNQISEDPREDNVLAEQPSRDYAFAVKRDSESSTGTVALIVGGVEVPDVLIDSGATCNLMGRGTWEWLKKHGVKCESQKQEQVLFAYGSKEPLPTMGTFTTEIESLDSNVRISADFVVIKGEGRTLLCKETAEKLNLLRVGPMYVNGIGNTADDIRVNYPELFEGVGMLKDYELKLHIDESVQPVAQQVRRLPFGLRKKTDKKLDELLEMGIIEEVPEGPTGWVSPLVVIPKEDGDVRVCVDMRRANQAITRERHPIPTIEEVLHDLNGSTVFSKLDLKWGFHQILLKEESRHITTFTTHRGLYRYRRLMFGITSAPEKYQQIIGDVLRTCKGVANIADDLIVHGRNLEEHDQRLFAVLNVLKEVGLTLNGKKCEFRLPKLTFFGHELTKKGVNPSEEKVTAIRDAKPPKDASEVRSFMGLVQYSAKFILNLASVAQPIQELTKKGARFVWGPKQQSTFEELKRLVTSADTLAYFEVGCRTRIVADASPVGLGAVLTQL